MIGSDSVQLPPASRPAPPAPEAVSPPWQPDRGDGTYRNPVLYADYSDPDAVRVGEDYWLTSSSFGHVPALPILHSRDLVNWTLVNHALPLLVPPGHFSTPRHGQGVWAPSLRYHAGKFWIFYPDPDFGLYMITADDPRGRWSEPVLVKAGKGLIDPCPLWDDDGRAYLVHAWAKSRSGIKNRLTLHRLAPDGSRVLDDGIVIVDGDRMEGWNTIEGPKFYKRAGYYYIFAPAGGVAEGYQAVFRARDVRGPYESRVVLAQGATPVNGPHQGAWVDTPAGEHWFLHFQELPPYGRVVHLQPMRWIDDWPQMGTPVAGHVAGEPVLVHRLPGGPRSARAVPATSDEFEAAEPGRQWQWQANPQPGWASLSARRGWLRLACVPAAGPTLWTCANLLLQKFPAPAFEVATAIDAASLREGECAGLVVFGYDYAWVGVRRGAGGATLVYSVCHDAVGGGRERTVALGAPGPGPLRLGVAVAAGGVCRFGYGDAAGRFHPVGEAFPARSSMWVGAKVGVFAQAPADATTCGHADVNYFRVTGAA